MTTLLSCAKDGVLSGETAADLFSNLVDAGMNRGLSVHVRVEKELHQLGS